MTCPMCDDPKCTAICPTCGGEYCPHGICADNWCNADHHCTECADREWAEIEAEDNVKYYEGDFE